MLVDVLFQSMIDKMVNENATKYTNINSFICLPLCIVMYRAEIHSVLKKSENIIYFNTF